MHIARLQKGREKATGGAEARRAKELKIIEKNKWSLDRPTLPGDLHSLIPTVERKGKLVQLSRSTFISDVKILRERAITR